MGGKKKQNNKKSKSQNNKKLSGNTNSSKNNVPPKISQKPKLTVKEKEELDILSDLRMRTRSLLACMQGVAPDGSPFAVTVPKDNADHHPLSALLESIFLLLEKLMIVQRDLKSGSHIDGKNDVEEKGTTDPMNDNRDVPEKWDAFSEWLERCQINPKQREFPIEIRKSENVKSGYGVYATRDIGYDEVIVEIPVSAMISPYWDHMLASISNTIVPKPPPFDPKTSSNHDQRLQQLSLVTFLANEKWRGNNSPFAPYINSLPITYSTPLYWSLDSMRKLKVTAHLKRAVGQLALAIWDYLRVRDQLEELNQQSYPADIIPPTYEFSYELFRWAMATVHTRQNMIPFIAEKQEGELSNIPLKTNQEELDEIVQNALALVPLWDLINHEDSERACSSEVVYLQNKNENISLETQKPEKKTGLLICRTPLMPKHVLSREENNDKDRSSICFRRGEEIKMYYGERTNVQLLFQSGFVYVEEQNKDQNNNKLENKILNLNKRDVTILRLALPMVNLDKDLHRVREMIAARYGFKLYVNQNCPHDGLLCARIASKYVSGSKIHTSEQNTSTGDEIDSDSVVMAEFSLSPRDPYPLDLIRASLLCVADKDELNFLLRNMEKYMNISSTTENWILSQLKNKHISFLQEIVQIYQTKSDILKEDFTRMDCLSEDDTFWIAKEEAQKLSLSLAACEISTLNEWLAIINERLFCTKDLEKPE